MATDDTHPAPSPAQIRPEVFRELVGHYAQVEHTDFMAAQTLRFSHIIEHGTEPATQ